MAYLRAKRCLCLLFVLLFAIGCVEKKPTTSEEEKEAGISPTEGVPATMFPHPAGWVSPASHGGWVVQFGHEVCFKCHKQISVEEEPLPTCASCHPLYPHKAEWIKKENHGNAFMVKGRSACATQCHGLDLGGGLSGISCELCHTIYPHSTDWADPTQHGESAEGDGDKLCTGCHGDDLLGGSSGVSCNTCHVLYPHAEDWVQKDQHGAHVLQNGQTGCMTQCHGIDLSGGLSGISCDSCHNLYPHSATWLQEHGQTATTLGLDACKGCHGDDFTTILDGQNCFSCHADYPHPDSSSWIPYAGGHGQKIQETYNGDTVSCEGCHGADLKELKQGQNCFSCHPSYLHDEQSTTIPWNTYEGHGQYTLDPNHPLSGCAICHGSDFQGGNRGNPSCFSCHVSYPHLDGWKRPPGQAQEHGNYVQANGTSSCATARCHGVNLVPSPGISKGVSCDSCHAAYPHPAGWISGLSHGPPALADINNCKSCHGAGLDQAPPGYSTCKQCHPTYLQHASADMGVIAWAQTGHGAYIRSQNRDMSECQLCHGSDYLGGISNQSCKTCHPSFPHDPGWDAMAGHGVYVMATLSNDLTKCKLCHGNNLSGGTSGISCDSCHANYPHPSNWASPSQHGPQAYGAAKNSCASANCHGTNFSGSTYGPGCDSCHADFPHIDPNWTSLPNPVHATTFIDRIKNDPNACTPPAACTECHGSNYARSLGGVSCASCHPNGVTHTCSWMAPGSAEHHGQYFTSSGYSSTSDSSTANCWTCHGQPVTFNSVQTKSGLASLSACYQCHWAYPHTAYLFFGNVVLWEPASPSNYGHNAYMIASPLMTDANGDPPPSNNQDPRWIDVIQNTCWGSTNGSCHFNGYRSNPSSSGSAMCGQACHQP